MRILVGLEFIKLPFGAQRELYGALSLCAGCSVRNRNGAAGSGRDGAVSRLRCVLGSPCLDVSSPVLGRQQPCLMRELSDNVMKANDPQCSIVFLRLISDHGQPIFLRSSFTQFILPSRGVPSDHPLFLEKRVFEAHIEQPFTKDSAQQSLRTVP